MALQFDLSQIPEGVTITNATLSLYSLSYDLVDTIHDDETNIKNIGKWAFYEPSNNLKYLYPIETDWEESSANWETVNSYDVYDFNTYTTLFAGFPYEYTNIDSSPPNAISFGGSRERDLWEEYDITAYLNEVYTGQRENHGFFMSMLRTDSVYVYIFTSNYASSQYEEKHLRPKLTITYDVKESNAFSTYLKEELSVEWKQGHYWLHNPLGEPVTYRVFDIFGREVIASSGLLDKKNVLLDLPNGNGVYFLSISIDGRREVLRLQYIR